MVYTENQVIEIIQSITDEAPELIIEKWGEKDSNKEIDLEKQTYPLFVYTFPIIINSIEVAAMTLVSLHLTGYDSYREELMRKYLGHKTYETSWQSYLNHDTYLEAYLTIKEEFELPTIEENYHSFVSSFQDKNGQEIKYRISIGVPEHDIKSNNVYSNEYIFENNMTIEIEKKIIEGNSLGEEINNNIRKRISSK